MPEERLARKQGWPQITEVRIKLLQEEGPLPGPETGLLSNTQK